MKRVCVEFSRNKMQWRGSLKKMGVQIWKNLFKKGPSIKFVSTHFLIKHIYLFFRNNRSLFLILASCGLNAP